MKIVTNSGLNRIVPLPRHTGMLATHLLHGATHSWSHKKKGEQPLTARPVKTLCQRALEKNCIACGDNQKA